MKTFTLKNISNPVIFIALLAFIIPLGNAQSSSYGNIFVADNGQMHVFTTDFNFMTQVAPAAGTKTSRTSASYGRISFADAVLVSTSNFAAVTGAKYIDGYFRKYGTSAINFPIGNSSIYAPVRVVPTDATGVDGAYFRSNPTTVGTVLDATVGVISAVEYWNILRPSGGTSNARISLSWSSTSASTVATLTTSSLASLTIAGWNGTSWVAIPSAYDVNSVIDNSSTTLTSGSITSTSNVDLSTYKFFTLAGKPNCSPLVAVNALKATTWNGTSWSNGVPDLEAAATLTANFSGNLSCNTLAMGAFNVTLANGQLLEIVNGVTGTGKVIMASEASVVQRNSASVAPAIELTKLSRSMLWRDYIFYGTPISGNFLGQLTTNTWNQGQSFVAGGSFEINNANGLGGPFEYIVNNGGWNAILRTTTGKGFIAMIKANAPWVAGTATTTPSNTGQVNFKFDGTANNGNVVVPVSSHATKFELLANPYPSALDAQKFLVGNANLDGAVYFWTAKTPRVGPGTNATTYTNADYAVWTLAGATNTSPISQKPDGKIASAQGFRVRAASGTTATFTNCMRLTSGNNNFFRQATTSIDRFSMNIQDTNNSGSYSQMLVAYMPEATADYDRMYDAEKFSSSPLQLYSVLGNGSKLSINAKPAFIDIDRVPIGFSNTTADQTFTITIEDKEGIFAGNDIYVFIYDKLNNVYHDMSIPFTFNANAQTNVNDRFEIVYQRNALHNNDFYANEVLVNIKDNMLTAKAIVGMVQIEIFDIAGRKIQVYNVDNAKTFSKAFNHAEGVYIAKVKLANGSMSTQKLINKK